MCREIAPHDWRAQNEINRLEHWWSQKKAKRDLHSREINLRSNEIPESKRELLKQHEPRKKRWNPLDDEKKQLDNYGVLTFWRRGPTAVDPGTLDEQLQQLYYTSIYDPHPPPVVWG